MHWGSNFWRALLPATIGLGRAQHVVDLAGDGWTVSSEALNISVPGKLPSHVHLDLLAAKVIGDPYYGLNDFNQRWVCNNNWTYTSHPLQNLLKNATSSWLVFNGLDTFTTIEVCGQVVGTTDNQFRQYTFNVSQALRDCKDLATLALNFGSAPKIADAIANNPESEVWPNGPQLVYEFPNRWFIRKEQSDFGWDWGPAFAPAGPWKDASMVQFARNDGIFVLNTNLDIYRQGQINYLPPDQSQPWVVNASIDFIGDLPKDASMHIELIESHTGKVMHSAPLNNISISGRTITGSCTVNPDAPKLWWPLGLGQQDLYNATITVQAKDQRALAQVEKRTGFRTIFLNQLNITDEQLAQGIAPGANWHFEVNGREFYAKGSNFIPPDAFWPRVTEERMQQLFNAVVAGNQNMLRVWASGAYLPDFIYDIADQAGVLLWSEFEFGDALYPTDKAFLENVAAEVKYNVRRMNHHPSLALWAGGNELESLELPLVKAASPQNYSYYVGQYEKLFISTILPLVYENSRSISYMPSSTGNGYLYVNLSAPVPMAERYDNVTSGHYYSDTDHYNYDSSVAFDFGSYPVGRFANEFGYHSMPSLQTWQQAVSPEDLHFNSSTIVLRNHHYPPGGPQTDNFTNPLKGMGEMTIAVERYYPVPHKNDSLKQFSAWCHATQLFQADMYKSEIIFYRRGSGLPERQLGSLYWQLEDIWQAPTWAGIEYDGRWKVLHYVTRDVYQPIIVSPFWNYTTRELSVWVTSDLWGEAKGTVNLTWVDMTGNPIAENAGTPQIQPFSVGGLNTTKIYETNTSKLSIPDNRNAVLILSMTADGYMPNSQNKTTFTHREKATVVWPNEISLVDPKIELARGSDDLTFTLEAKGGVALYTWLDYPAGVVGYFDDNVFTLIPGEKKTVQFTVQKDDTNGKWADGVTVRSLWDQTTN
ncbi:Beta-mannosidase A [Penicillium diatomitis]|uniref:Beta-mannosidase A n=1 Tax=Penicillium diatomitis TaxID=2819901 RepID=A0A9W9XPA4_9EURO|nr:Beta-mannosidase A [Penicillium diatomitis]KAJ5495889.1 Beta-mannosidase A [Penicillium diatomitis]